MRNTRPLHLLSRDSPIILRSSFLRIRRFDALYVRCCAPSVSFPVLRCAFIASIHFESTRDPHLQLQICPDLPKPNHATCRGREHHTAFTPRTAGSGPASTSSAMSTKGHLRNDSSESSSSSSSYQLILDHILSYPGSYEIPLRTMYTLNCAPRAQPPRSATPSSTSSSPFVAQGSFHDDKATQTFTENLMTQIQQLPNQPASLPPSFITSFLRRCFPGELVDVDFPQALTGLDYLKDLETRRRREVAGAMDRLGIDSDLLGSDANPLTSRYPGVAQWVKSIEEKERKIEALYTQVFVGLRRWILINELSLLPFNKHNCVAMLNTLYPPVVQTQPTSKLTPAILKNQRDGFFSYIRSVEKSGPRVLSNLMQQGKAITDANGWVAVTRTLGMYLQLATSIISECADITDVQHVSERVHGDSREPRAPRKVDSGVSFNTTEIPSTRSSSIAEPASPIETTRAKTPSGVKHSTTLEKLARGLRTIGRSRTDVTEMIADDPLPPPEKTKTLRKMRSLGSMDSRKGSKTDVAAVQHAAFDAEDMRRQRMKYENGAHASPNLGSTQSFEV